MKGLRPTRAIVDLDALARNFHAIQEAQPAGCRVMPVVKADGYGHGAVAISRRLVREGSSALAVAVVEEGVELRRAGVDVEILVMGWIGDDQLGDLVRHRLVGNAHSLDVLKSLAAFANAEKLSLPIHLKVDTGMTRLGLRPEDIPEALEVLAASELRAEGLFQNFASADEAGSPQTEAQVRTFVGIYEALAARGLRLPIHVANSAATLRPPALPDSLPKPSRVRPGLAIFRDVMSFVSVVDQLKRVPKGTRVGYGGTFETARETVIAIAPVGYADGVPRSLSPRGHVVVNGQRCAIVGRVSMDLTAIDVTDVSPLPVSGDDVVFFGEGLPVGEMAETAGTVPWEILCGVGPRVPRVVLESGAEPVIASRFLVS